MRMMKLGGVLFLLCISLEVCAKSAAVKVLVLGDSLSAGFGIRSEYGWVRLMQQDLQTRHGVQLLNASVSGETSSGGLTRLPALLRDYQPGIVVLELGGNDGLRGQPLTLLESNLQAMIDAALGSGARVLLVGMQIPGSYGARYSKQFKEIFPKIAAKNKLSLVPFLLEAVAVHPEWMQTDGIHPKEEGQARMKENVLPFLLPMLKLK
ncbi:arylesterase [Undibacterium parvum]|uniref:Arylesterase n=3 Tax=Undibacterium TaxID=401469 RepID=A0A6M4AAW0_9BURK|nr:arylesterase [Undibacterium parvum]QJQ07800.1 arylesterase [Undibacterium piscinae]